MRRIINKDGCRFTEKPDGTWVSCDGYRFTQQPDGTWVSCMGIVYQNFQQIIAPITAPEGGK